MVLESSGLTAYKWLYFKVVGPMLLICPACQSRYTIGAAAIPPDGRAVKCARCGHKWRQMPEADELTFSSGPADDDWGGEVQTQERPQAAVRSQDDDVDEDFLRRLGEARPEPIPEVFSRAELDGVPPARGGWLTSILVALIALAVVAIGAILARETVISSFPATAALYEMIGLPGNVLGAGLDLRNIVPERETENGTPVLVVRGVVINVSSHERVVPMIRVALFDETESVVQEETVTPVQERLDPGETIAFRARLVNPAAAAKRLEVTFAPAPAGS